MSTAPAEFRVRRPKDKEELVQQLLADKDGPFRTMAEVLLFAAAVGWFHRRREPLKEVSEPIRYEIFRKSPTAEAFIDSIGVLAYPADPQVLSNERLGERITVFEEYANGGLAEIQGEKNESKGLTVTEVLLEMTRRAGRETTPGQSGLRELEGLLGLADWT